MSKGRSSHESEFFNLLLPYQVPGVFIMDIVKVGVIGLGRMGTQHCRVYSGLKLAQLVGVCDVNVEAGMAVARRFGVPFYQDAEELLKNVDAVSIVTPTPYHFEMAMKCISEGIPTLIEKPIAETNEQAEIITEAVKKSGLVVQVGHIERFNPAYIELKNVLEGMRILAVNFRRLSAYAGSNKDVDVVLDLMIHDTDLVINLTGCDASCIVAAGLSAYGIAVDHGVAQLCFDNGTLATLSASRITEEKIRTIEVTALDAYLEANLLNKTVTIHRRTISQYLNQNHQNVKYRQESILESVVVPVVEPLLAELQHFVQCVIENKTPLVSANDGMRALRLALGIRSAMQGNLVDVSKHAPINLPVPISIPNLV
jgi:virulence factor